MKQKIKEIKKNLSKELRMSERIRPQLLSIPLIPDDLGNEEKKSLMYKDKKGEQLKEFIELLMKEFKKSYKFFTQIEKDLIKKMNTHLYTQTSYSTYNLSELTKEMKLLSLTVYLAKCLNAFINDTMMALKKILKKFDKNFSTLYGLITPHLILQLLTKNNSELEYLLQYKVIDEINTISESNVRELNKYFIQNNEHNENDREEFLKKYNDSLQYIQDIDELIYFKTQYKSWIDNISGRNTMRKGFNFCENDIFNPVLSSSYYKENLLDKFLSTKEAFATVEKIKSSITNENKRNIILILFQTFFYNTLLTNIFPIIYYYEYIRSLDKHIYNELWFVNFFLFLVIGSMYLAQYLAIFLFYNYTSIKSIKSSFLLSFIFIFIGSFFYIFSIVSNQGHFKVRALILGLSRTLIGFGSNAIIGKKYLTMYSPRYSLPLISKIYLAIELLGQIIGPLITASIIYIDLGKICCIFNCIGYYGIFGSIILYIFFALLFVSPNSDIFAITKNEIKGNINMSNSQKPEEQFEDVEDIQDQEFYRLQRDKKNKIESTKSDEIKIEVIDDDDLASKEINNKVINNTDESNEDEDKEKENNDYLKIMEKAEDYLGQNEIADNYYNNVDNDAYSSFIMTDDQKNNMKDIEAKLLEYQESSTFTHVNMMPRTLDDIIINEQKTFGYINRNLLIMFILFFFNNLIKENLIVHSSYFMLFKAYKNGNIIKKAEEINNMINEININNTTDNNNTDINYGNDTDINDFIYLYKDIDKIVVSAIDMDSFNKNNPELDQAIINYSNEKKSDIQTICILTSCIFSLQLLSLFFIMPFYKINIFFKKYLIICITASVLLMVVLSFDFFYSKIYLYVPIVSIDILLHKIIETICSCYLVYLVPPKWRYAHIRASSLPIYLMTLGKIGGCIFCWASYNIEQIAFNQYVLTALTIIIYGFIALFFIRSKNFRVSALARILRNKSLEKY